MRFAAKVFSPWFPNNRALRRWLAAAVTLLLLGGCGTSPHATTRNAAPPRTDDEIIVAGQRFHTGTRVVTWLEPNGYNAYRGAPRYELRNPIGLAAPEAARVVERGWDLPALQKVVDQFVLHYDAEGLSRLCFEVLSKPPRLSVHFLLDVDGTIYQTLDLQERAAHATIANSRSIGIELANIGAYPPAEAAPTFNAWYRREPDGGMLLVVPQKVRESGIFTRDFVGRPVRPIAARGVVQGKDLVQYDFTAEQYAALAKLTATLCRVFPKIACEFPRDAKGQVRAQKLSEREFADYRGILGHFHIQENKVDPGPAFQWEKFLAETRRELR